MPRRFQASQSSVQLERLRARHPPALFAGALGFASELAGVTALRSSKFPLLFFQRDTLETPLYSGPV